MVRQHYSGHFRLGRVGRFARSLPRSGAARATIEEHLAGRAATASLSMELGIAAADRNRVTGRWRHFAGAGPSRAGATGSGAIISTSASRSSIIPSGCRAYGVMGANEHRSPESLRSYIVGTYDKDAGPNNQRPYLNGTRVAQMSDTLPIDLNSAALGIGRHVSGVADPSMAISTSSVSCTSRVPTAGSRPPGTT
jgi:hypothetical protein